MKRTKKRLPFLLWKTLYFCAWSFPYVCMIWFGYFHSLEIYNFHKYGVERTAKVVEVVYEYKGKGGSEFKTKLLIGNSLILIQKALRVQLAVGEDISVLIMPDEPYKLTLGNKNNSIIELYFYVASSLRCIFSHVDVFSN
jgi:hypothetical protein